MAIEYIDSSTLKKMFVSGAKHLESKKAYVDKLNVFPVPDGDTGTNMSLTILSAAKEVSNSNYNNMKEVAGAISSGSLRGARGNSGVILSQLLRGFSKVIAEHDKIDTLILAKSFQKGVETAYRAVMKPKEGTILTVARETAERAAMLAIDSNDIEFVIRESINYAKEVLEKTPDMLDVLKQAGVVDAGGQGLLYIFEGAFMSLQAGEELDFDVVTDIDTDDEVDNSNLAKIPTEDIKFGYCTEFIINVNNPDTTEEDSLVFRSYLETIGDSIVVAGYDDIIKVHVHTNDPGLAIQKALELGELVNMKIDNMRQQHTSKVISEQDDSSVQNNKDVSEEPRKEVGFVAVSIGDGLKDIFKSLGVDYIIQGGQTMNPSTEDVLNAIKQVNADNVFVLPNNKNIILAAKQASELCEDKNVIVIPSKSIPQGISAMISYEHENSVDDNITNMEDSMTDVSTGQLTFAVRDTSIDEKEIKEGDILGIGNDKILAVEKELDTAAKELVEQLVDDDSELVIIYYGEEVDENVADDFGKYIEEKFEDCDVEVHYGGQPLYYYILSVE
ncbi:DAK2 domain-containing protein [Vallitalea guaymasensis]|uniref:DAK2 domain-containing protein n=1 Tax=Vallitalea guaymasensis TaxID=1185412 RepID=A0A8J8M736_9FIRM|nr:DAK2 domain-containing protein [Vallitalea guaymasensis]QUH27423.1 DAK2 domain-containing protein [Vallitalea guaymasensis]